MGQRIFGIDPGTLQFGYGLLEAEHGEGAYVTAGVIKAPRSLAIGVRLYRIHTELLSLLETWRPDIIAVEETFRAAGGQQPWRPTGPASAPPWPWGRRRR